MYDSLRMQAVQSLIIPVVGELIRSNPGRIFGMQDRCYLRIAYGALEKETALEGISRSVRGLKQILSR